jgi:hypothetical protein
MTEEEERHQHHQAVGREDIPQLRLKSCNRQKERREQWLEKGDGSLGS